MASGGRGKTMHKRGAKFGHVVTEQTRQKPREAFRLKPKSQEFRDRVSQTLRATLPKGPGHHAWKGGLWKHHSGYVYAYCLDHPGEDKDHYVKRARLIAEKRLGRFLTMGECVHHLNGIKDDDRPDNLMVFGSESEHQKYHVLTGTHNLLQINREGRNRRKP